jgi:glycosyltransferase involved in cell wall biosynthesis
MTSTRALAGELLDLVEQQLAALADGPLPELDLPGMLLGHEVGPDVRADLLFTLGLLHEAGRTTVGDVEVVDALSRLLAGIDGRRTHTFYSYRVAETVARFGPLEGNALLADLSAAQRQQVAAAADSTDWFELLDAGILPRNYAAVLTRCELARARLGVHEDRGALDALLPRVRDMLGGHLDDSNAGIGRFDIYTVDLHLFCEPFADLLGAPWRDGARAALDLVDRVATPDGAAVPWGRSTGVLAVCHTVELGGLVARDHGGDGTPAGASPLTPDPLRWWARAAHAAAQLQPWFRDGWVTAHQHRASDPYRGLDRRLQMTLDCLGKLVDAALGLLAVPDTPVTVDERELFPERDELVQLDASRHAGAWSYRGGGTAFVLPVVGGTTTDYVATPRRPGLYEAPTGSELIAGAPMLFDRGQRYVAGGLPALLEHRPGELHGRYDGFPAAGFLEPGPSGSDGDTSRSTEVVPGHRDVTWRVEGRTLLVEEHLELERAPAAIALQVTEADGRPLHVTYECDTSHRTAVIDTAGLAEFRSCWGELPRTHQIDLEPATSLHLRWSVTPVLRSLTTAPDARYQQCLYEPLEDRVQVSVVPYSALKDPAELRDVAARADQFHLHWPEWLLLDDDEHHAVIDVLRGAGVRIVWTQHNLIGHDKDRSGESHYRAWAAAADLVIHHSDWGRRRALATYPYRPEARHVVIPHGHFGPEALPDPADRAASRAEVEAELGLRPGVLRLGIVGAPRVEKDLELVMRAVARCSRDDLELLVLSLRGDEVVPDDSRIVARRYEEVPRDEYDRRLAALDALVMPFDPEGEMLTTGTVADAVGHGLATVASDWQFLTEALGDAAITYGRSEDELVACLESLTAEVLGRAASAAAARRGALDWSAIAAVTYAELDRLGGPM